MTRILQINITANWGSHGRIAEGIGLKAMQEGWESHIAYGRWMNPSRSRLYRIGSHTDEFIHGMATRIFDCHGLMSKRATRHLLDHIARLQPDIIHLHNIHGYYLNYPLLFRYLTESGIPVVWTLHDCWAYTGHCAHYMFTGCRKWQTHCDRCPAKDAYPRSVVADRSYGNFERKRQCFLSPQSLTLVPVSRWLENELKRSFFRGRRVRQIYNGIDCRMFRPDGHDAAVRQRHGIPGDHKMIIGVASNWYRKGLDDFLALRSLLPANHSIVLVGLGKRELRDLPQGIIGLRRTQNQEELAALYSAADVYFNPTWEDNFPTTNLEALSCGTPVVTYDTGGSPEAIGPGTGRVVARGDVYAASRHILEIGSGGKAAYGNACRERVTALFDRDARFADYITLYKDILKETGRRARTGLPG